MTFLWIISFVSVGAEIKKEDVLTGAAKASDKNIMASYSKEIQDSLTRLRNLTAQKYYKDIDSFRTDLEKYFEHKKRVCDGEFSTVILSELKAQKGNRSKKKIKLSSDERKLCFRELKALQVTFVNNMYVARKRYLEYLHINRLKELTQAREDSIKSIRASFDKR
jgi:hypothetical protein